MSIYYDQSGSPVFRRSLCVFVDVLGFAETQRRTFGTDVESSHFNDFYTCIRKELDQLNESGSGILDVGVPCEPSSEMQEIETLRLRPRWQMKVFTDNIVLGFPLFTHDAESEIGTLAFSLAPYQMALARRGYFVRGGISIGQLFMDEFIAYGPALLEAYEIEHALARDPRIVVSPEVGSLLKQHFSYYMDPEDAPQNRQFLLDTDGQIFVNYLGWCFRPDDEGGVDEESLQLHKTHIEKGLQDHVNDPRIWAKYSWLATYHDYAILESIRDPETKRSLTIDGKRHRSGPVRICPSLVPSWEERCRQAE